MKFIGYNGTHDASIVIFNEEGNLEFYAEAERFGPRNKKTNNLTSLIETFPNIDVDKNDLIATVALNQDAKATENYIVDLPM